MSIEVTPQESEILKEIYMVSNTPFFLYKNYSSLEFIKSKVSRLSFSEIKINLHKFLNEETKSLDVVVMIYMLIISLKYYADYKKVSELLLALQKIEFEWVSKISSYIFNLYSPESTNIIDIKYKITTIQCSIKNTNDQSTSEVNFPQRHAKEDINVINKNLFNS